MQKAQDSLTSWTPSLFTPIVLIALVLCILN